MWILACTHAHIIWVFPLIGVLLNKFVKSSSGERCLLAENKTIQNTFNLNDDERQKGSFTIPRSKVARTIHLDGVCDRGSNTKRIITTTTTTTTDIVIQQRDNNNNGFFSNAAQSRRSNIFMRWSIELAMPGMSINFISKWRAFSPEIFSLWQHPMVVPTYKHSYECATLLFDKYYKNPWS